MTRESPGLTSFGCCLLLRLGSHDVTFHIAEEAKENEVDLFPDILSRMRDNVLILTEDVFGTGTWLARAATYAAHQFPAVARRGMLVVFALQIPGEVVKRIIKFGII